MLRLLSFSVLLLAASCGFAQSQLSSPVIDGHFSEWDARAVTHRDPAGDSGASGLDLRTLRVDSDAEWVYISFELAADLLLQQDNALKLLIDTDMDANSGTRWGGIGAELLWDFAKREGTVKLGTSSSTVKHQDIGYFPAPSMTSSRFELAFRRDTKVAGRALFPTERMRLVLYAEEQGGDRLPDADGGVGVELRDSAPTRGDERTLRPKSASAVRLLSWNVLQNGLLDPARRPVFERMLRAIQPDVLCFQECFELSAQQVQGMIEATLQAPQGKAWRALKTDAGNVMVTHLDIEADWLIQQNYRESAYLLRTPTGQPLLVINAHLRCCNANDKRQQEADGVIAFLRDARTPGGRIDVPTGTPMIMAGDFNLVGFRQQYITLTTGDIVDNATHGPDSPPDWDGGPWTELEPLHPVTPFTYTWYDTGSNYAPGKLDYILYTASAVTVEQQLVFNTAEMSDAELARHGVQRGDAASASDHLPRIADFLLKNTSGSGALPREDAPLLGAVYPQPAREALHFTLSSTRPEVRLALHDVLGRSLLRDKAATSATGGGAHVLTLPALPAGRYLLTASDERRISTRAVTLH